MKPWVIIHLLQAPGMGGMILFVPLYGQNQHYEGLLTVDGICINALSSPGMRWVLCTRLLHGQLAPIAQEPFAAPLRIVPCPLLQ